MKKFTKATAGVLAVFFALGALTSCQNSYTEDTKTETSYSASKAPESPNEKPSQTMSLEDVKPTFKQYNGLVSIDENSAMQIVEIALNDAQEFYESIGAPNMKYKPDLSIATGENNFYTDWMNKYFYLARMMSESSLQVNAKAKLPTPTECGDTHAVGPMQLCENSIKSTLMQYYSGTFKTSVDLTNLKIVPSEQDIANVQNSKQAQKNIVEAVYNNVYLSICFDIYNTKCLNPIKHEDYYKAYGGFDEDIRKLAAIGLYCSSRKNVLNGLYNGNLEEQLRSNKDINTYLNNLDKYEKLYKEKFNQNDYGFQPQ